MELGSEIFTLFALALLLLGPFVDMIHSRGTHNVCQKAESMMKGMHHVS